ncbi:hypothetical protein PIB30_075487 [Stylosanthes scabra]|uniref:Uncharacterized protein n=1 Tax=Stylosanthes scabra TaxID=79078 RepID=A0ABU6VQ12_9FABA|nr:hypothetical protein [Stylosanthes scabra]
MGKCTVLHEDYYYSYYPVTLPLRRPYSGNPELLDEEEFGEAAESRTYDENSTNQAKELGLLFLRDHKKAYLKELLEGKWLCCNDCTRIHSILAGCGSFKAKINERYHGT